MINKKVNPQTKEKLLNLDLEAVKLFSPGLNKWFYHNEYGYRFQSKYTRTYEPYIGVKMHIFTLDCYTSATPYTREVTAEDLMKEYKLGRIVQQ